MTRQKLPGSATGHRPRTRFLTRIEFAALQRTAPNFLKPMLVLAVETGMRREALLGLTVRAIDLERREISSR